MPCKLHVPANCRYGLHSRYFPQASLTVGYGESGDANEMMPKLHTLQEISNYTIDSNKVTSKKTTLHLVMPFKPGSKDDGGVSSHKAELLVIQRQVSAITVCRLFGFVTNI